MSTFTSTPSRIVHDVVFIGKQSLNTIADRDQLLSDRTTRADMPVLGGTTPDRGKRHSNAAEPAAKA